MHASEYIETTVAQHAPSALKPPVARQSPASTAKQVASTTPFRRAPAASVLMHPRSCLWVPAQTTRPSGKRAAVQAVEGMPGLDEKGAKVAECTPPSPSPFLCTADVRPSSCSLGPTITFLRKGKPSPDRSCSRRLPWRYEYTMRVRDGVLDVVVIFPTLALR